MQFALVFLSIRAILMLSVFLMNASLTQTVPQPGSVSVKYVWTLVNVPSMQLAEQEIIKGSVHVNPISLEIHMALPVNQVS